MKRIVFFAVLLCMTLGALAQQSGLRGVVVDATTNKPIEGAQVYLKGNKIKVTTNKNGEFRIERLTMGVDELTIVAGSFEGVTKKVSLINGKLTNTGLISMSEVGFVSSIKNSEEDIRRQRGMDAVMVFDESMLEDGSNTQSASILSNSSDDVYLNATSYSFSPMRFSNRGYNQEEEVTYINGVNFNDQERGRFNYSSLGGLNDAMRNKETAYGLESTDYTYGSLGGATNILTNASRFAAGSKSSVAFSNRSYKLRAQTTYATGLLSNGWAFVGSLVYRWADEGIVQGTFYNSFGYFLGAEKILNNEHKISVSTFGAPTQRAQQGASVQEAYDLVGSTYYNPYWGWQDGKKRNSRIVKSYDPTVIFNHEWKRGLSESWKTGLGFHYSKYSNSALTFYNAPDPRPDYYRNMPSYTRTSLSDNTSNDYINDYDRDFLTSYWTQIDPRFTQLNWQRLYASNYAQNAENPDASGHYSIERRHNDLMEGMLSSVYNKTLSQRLKLSAGVEAKYTQGMHYKTMDDLLGANQWIDIDQFADRDFSTNQDLKQNDLRNPNRVIHKGDLFGYNYDVRVLKGSAFIQNNWTLGKFDVFYAGRLSYTQFQREGYMENGRAPGTGAKGSFGNSKLYFFVDPSVKAGATYKLSGQQWFTANAMFEMRAPLASNAFITPRIRNGVVPNLQSERVLSYDVSYNLNTPIIRGRLTAFRTTINGSTEMTGFYHDEYRTFINHVLTGLDKLYQGIELGVKAKLNSYFSLSFAGTISDQRYTNNSIGYMSAENGVMLGGPGSGKLPENEIDRRDFSVIKEKVYTKDLKISNGPQLAATLGVHYFHPKLWFVDLTGNYFNNNYLDFAPFRFTQTNISKYTPDQKKVLGSQELLPSGFLLDASIGKLIYLKGRSQSLNINLSCNNILNNRNMITGGFQQARISVDDGVINSVNKFPSKYYYAWGFNMFLNVGYKF